MTAAELAAALGAKRSGRQFVCRCVAHEDREPSMIIFDGHTGVQVRCMAGCRPADIIAVLRERGLWGESIDTKPLPYWRNRHLDAPRNPAIQQAHIADGTHRALALRIFREAASLTSSPMVNEYLAGRRLTPTPALACARFEQHCPRGDGRFPAIVVRMDALDCDQPRAIQRIFLKRVGDRVVKDGAPMMLGDAGSAAMKLTSHHSTFWDELSYCPILNIAEGFETACALVRDGISPTWALGSAGAIARMPVLFGVGAITVWADNDVTRFNARAELVNTGIDAGRQCCVRWAEAGRPARLEWRDVEGEDFADG